MERMRGRCTRALHVCEFSESQAEQLSVPDMKNECVTIVIVCSWRLRRQARLWRLARHLSISASNFDDDLFHQHHDIVSTLPIQPAIHIFINL